MPDEPIWGHYRRLIWLNGLHTIRDLTPEVDGSELRIRAESLRRHREVVYLLADSHRRPALAGYFRDHSIFFQLLSPEEIDRLSWTKLLFRWSTHHAWLVPSERVWRYCPVCALDDESGVGHSWFRRAHQHPGMDWCSIHGVELRKELCPDWLTVMRPSRVLHYPDARAPQNRNQIPDFVLRYIHALDWLHKHGSQPSRRAVAERTIEIIFEMIGRDEPLQAISRLSNMVMKAAPRAWYTQHFQKWNGHGNRSHEIALRAAAISTSISDLDSLFHWAKKQGTSGDERYMEWF